METPFTTKSPEDVDSVSNSDSDLSYSDVSNPDKTSEPKSPAEKADQALALEEEDLMNLLRRFYREERLDDVREIEGRIVFFRGGRGAGPGKDLEWPKDVKTNFRVQGSEQNDYYSLDCVVNFLKGARIKKSDQQDILDFMDGNTGKKSRKRIGEQAMTADPKIPKLMQEPPPKETRHHYDSSTPGTSGIAGKGMAVEKVDHFSRLPAEVIVKILSYLEFKDIAVRVQLVNHRFRKLCLNPSFWTEVEFRNKTPDHSTAIKLLKRCTLLKELNNGINDYREDSVILAIFALKNCPKLEKLGVVCSRDTDSGNFERLLQTIGKYGNALRELEMDGPWNPKVLKVNGACLCNLTHIRLFGPEGTDVTEYCLMAIADNCKRLQHVALFRINGLNDEVFNYFLEGVKSTLAYLRIEEAVKKRLTDASFKNLGKCGKLKTLNLYDCWNFRGEGFMALCELTELCKLEISYDDVEEAMTEYLNLHGGPFKKMTKLVSLDINFCLGDRGLRMIADNCPEFDNLFFHDCWNVSDEGLDYALRTCSKLSYLGISGYTRVGEAAFRNIQPSLKKLVFTEESIRYIGKACLFRLEDRHPGLKVRWINSNGTEHCLNSI